MYTDLDAHTFIPEFLCIYPILYGLHVSRELGCCCRVYSMSPDTHGGPFSGVSPGSRYLVTGRVKIGCTRPHAWPSESPPRPLPAPRASVRLARTTNRNGNGPRRMLNLRRFSDTNFAGSAYNRGNSGKRVLHATRELHRKSGGLNSRLLFTISRVEKSCLHAHTVGEREL